jgi:hypothetical protein
VRVEKFANKNGSSAGTSVFDCSVFMSIGLQ